MKAQNLARKFAGGIRVLSACLLDRPQPLFVGSAVTNRCNYRCHYCRLREDERELGTEEALRLIDEMAEAGTMQLGFTGGEPLLRDDMGKLVGHAVACGLTVRMNSNGALVQERVEVLEGISHLSISLEGPPDVHDAIRGPGAFDRAVAALRTARRLGVGTHLSATINAANVDRLAEVLGLAADLSVRVTFQPAVDSRLGSDEQNRMRSDPGAYRLALEGLMRDKRRFRPSTIANSVSGLRHLARWPQDSTMRCAGGIVGCRLEPGGDVYHCGRVCIDRPDKNAVQAGFQAAFRSLGPTACTQCWCARRVELNLLCRLRWDVVLQAMMSEP
jgi:MoaA/NifB/PqqE/SkfB family radical SAM enzyme